MKSNRVQKLVSSFLEIESSAAKSSNMLGYIARSMTVATFPHSEPKEHYFQRTNGNMTISMIGHPQIGLPYGSLLRLLLAWMTREAKLKKSPVLYLGKSFSEFLSKLQLSRSGGARGDITRLRNQMLRLFSTQISCVYQDHQKGRYQANQFLITKSFDLWWTPLSDENCRITDKSSITLTQDFYEELIDRPVPIDLRMLNALRRSPLQMDIYAWLTYRFFYLKKSSMIPWTILVSQFGSHYANTPQGLRDFRREFLKALNVVMALYQGANIDVVEGGIKLKPSKTHVASNLKESI